MVAKNLLLLFPFALLAGMPGCGNMPELPSASTKSQPVEIQPLALTTAQKKLVSDSVREMVAGVTASGGEDAIVRSYRAFRLVSRKGIQICGDVSYQSEPGKKPVSTPYYVEIEERDGVLSASRGQIGTDKLKRSKVSFMCRHMAGG